MGVLGGYAGGDDGRSSVGGKGENVRVRLKIDDVDHGAGLGGVGDGPDMLELAGHAGTEANHMQEAPIAAESQRKISIRSHMGILRGGGGLSEGDR